MPLPELIDAYLRHLRDDLHRAERSLLGYRRELELLAKRGIPLEHDALAAFVSAQADGTPLAASSRNRRLSILRGFARYLLDTHALATDPLRGVERVEPPTLRRVVPSQADIERLLDVLRTERPTWRRTRDAALVILFAYTGLRLSEAVQLNVDQVDVRGSTLYAVRRKGGDVMDVPLHPCVRAQLELWLIDRPDARDRSLFPSGNRRRISWRRVQRRLRELGQKAGLGAPVHPHALRRAHGTNLMRVHVPLRVIQVSLNHSALATTALYLHWDAELLRSELARLPTVPPVPPARAVKRAATPRVPKKSPLGG